MSRLEGTPKTGGRQKGTPNKKTADLQSTLINLGFDLLDEIVKTIPDLKPDKKADVLLELMGFLYPRRKAIAYTDEISGTEDIEETVEETLVRLAESNRLLAELEKEDDIIAAYRALDKTMTR